MNRPICSIRVESTPDGDEYDCDAIHGEICENCLCLYLETGGRWNPDTGKQVSEKTAKRMYNAEYTGNLTYYVENKE